MLTSTRQGREDDRPVKRYLMEYTDMHRRREALKSELDRYNDIAMRSTGIMSQTGRSGAPNCGAREDSMLRIVDAEGRLKELIAHLSDCLTARLVLIEQLTDERHKTLLTMRYINGWNWDRIGIEIHYERTQVYDLHNTAIHHAQIAYEAAKAAEAAAPMEVS